VTVWREKLVGEELKNMRSCVTCQKGRIVTVWREKLVGEELEKCEELCDMSKGAYSDCLERKTGR
jgi:hypothetical protein